MGKLIGVGKYYSWRWFNNKRFCFYMGCWIHHHFPFKIQIHLHTGSMPGTILGTENLEVDKNDPFPYFRELSVHLPLMLLSKPLHCTPLIKEWWWHSYLSCENIAVETKIYSKLNIYCQLLCYQYTFSFPWAHMPPSLNV